MGILDRGLGHPARWQDVAVAFEQLQDHYICKLVVETYYELVDLKGVAVQIVVRATPTAWSPHANRKPIVKNRVWYLEGARPLSEGIYGLMWEVDSTAGIVWPIGRAGEE